MKPFEVNFRVMPATDTGTSVAVEITGPRTKSYNKVIASLADMETMAREFAAGFGENCAVWPSSAKEKVRKPVGFDAEAKRISKLFFPAVVA